MIKRVVLAYSSNPYLNAARYYFARPRGRADHQVFGDVLGRHQADQLSVMGDGQSLGTVFLQASQGRLDHLV